MSDTLKILVPIGFSDQSLKALDQAMVYAKAASSAHITLLAVIENGGFLKKVFTSKYDTDEYKGEVTDKMQSIANEYSQKNNIPIEVMVDKGLVYEEIARVSELVKADLVVMGTNGKSQNVGRRFIGSNTYRTVTLVEPPVVTVKGTVMADKVDTIIFPLVLDRRSKEKVGPALKYARIFNAKIKVVSVLNEDSDAKIMRGHIKQVENFVKDHDVECTSELIEPEGNKNVVKNTLRYSMENDADMIIIMEEERGTDLAEFLLGNDVQSMIYHSDIPVMCVTPSRVKWEAMWSNF